MKKITLTLLFGISWLISYNQNPTELLEQYLSSHHSEKIYVNHDKPYYLIGETIWCKVYLVDAITHQTYATEPIVYVDWISPKGKILKTYYLKIKNGVANLDIPTESTTKAGKYTLRAYTLYQKNFDPAFLFQKEIAITDFYENKSKTSGERLDFNLQLFPEGGDLVTGITSRVAFKVQNEKGENIVINGVVEMNNGQEIATIKTLNEGMGFFNVTPQKGSEYWVKVIYQNNEKKFPLPKAIGKGYGMKCDTRSSKHVKVSLVTNRANLLKGCQLIGHLRGQVFYNQIFENHAALTLAINQQELPTGLLTFTLFDEQQRPVCERLVYNKNPSQKVAVNISLEKEETKKRSLMKGVLSTLQQDTITPSQLSISVYNSSLMPDDLLGLTIENYLQLQSDLKGRIHNVNQYFDSDNAKTRTLLDLLLMTHGWRRFTWQQILDQQKMDITYPIETSFSFSGQITKELKDKPVKANVFLNVLDEENYAFANVTTGPDGLFHFEGFDFKDTTDLLIQANIYNEKKLKKVKEGVVKRVGNKAVDIDLFKLYELPVDATLSLKPGTDKPAEVLKKYAKEVAEVTNQEIIDSSLWSIDLSEVTVSRRKLTVREQQYEDLREKFKEKGMFYFGATDKFFTDDLYKYTAKFTDVFDLIRTAVPEARIAGTPANRRVYLSTRALVANGPGVLFALDGRIVPAARLDLIPPEAVYAIDVIKQLPATMIYGGVTISIITKDEAATAAAISKVQNVGIKQIRHPGFYQAKTFYSPVYDQPLVDSLASDYRVTLHWQPNIEITDAAQHFEFYTGDIEGNHLIWVEGITKEGGPFTGKASFFVRE